MIRLTTTECLAIVGCTTLNAIVQEPVILGQKADQSNQTKNQPNGKRKTLEVWVSSKDPNYIVKVEQAIAKKYGEETVQHPKANWTDDKERQYISELKDLYRQRDQLESEEEEIGGVFINKKLLNKESSRSCPVCSTYSFKSNDDVYMSKFDCCEKCYIQWVEGREERWLKGWRPNE